MREVVVFTRARFGQIDPDALRDLREQVLEHLQIVPGFISMSLWERFDDPFAFCTLGHYRSEADALQAFETLVSSDVYEAFERLLVGSPDILRLVVLEKKGGTLEQMRAGTFLSTSIRISDPGMEDELVGELSSIFDELAMIKGYKGSMVLQHDDVAEEIVGICFWGSRQSYEQSLPAKSLYRVDLYQRVL
ncbi:MAG: antibiotic biosynthesis monooxygenase [Fimbriimonadaceae bacterium]|nr:antibiotic biosynthesis monooxygenase [Fimbriimonadaceae bacterium]QYK55129.1 MAG: antibiotic biosynthesis monooxygenase [Fimbriimonadaceae bacterium]